MDLIAYLLNIYHHIMSNLLAYTFCAHLSSVWLLELEWLT